MTTALQTAIRLDHHHLKQPSFSHSTPSHHLVTQHRAIDEVESERYKHAPKSGSRSARPFDVCFVDQNLNLDWKEEAKKAGRHKGRTEERYWNRVWSTTVLRVRTSGSMGTWSYELIQQMKRYRMLVSPQTKAAVIP